MKIEIEENSGYGSIVTLKPKKKFPAGHDLSISFCNDFVCFTVYDKAQGINVQIDYAEWRQLQMAIKMLRK